MKEQVKPPAGSAAVTAHKPAAFDSKPAFGHSPAGAFDSNPAAFSPQPSAGWIVEDGAQLLPGQMEKSAFLARLRSAVCATAEAALAPAGRTAKDCPYLDYWFRYYSGREAVQIERSLLHYAPAAAGATSAEAYFAVAQERARRAIAKWVGTGEIDAPPEALEMREPAGMESPRGVQERLGPGSPLPGDVRGRMETAFGHNFSQVRVHADEAAGRLSANLNARAFTVGSDIGFAQGAYQPGIAMGDALLAHELAHVAQQDGAKSEGPAGGYDALEADAGRSTLAAMARLWGGAGAKLGKIAGNALPRIRSGLSLQRCDKCDPQNHPLPDTKIPEVPPDLDCSKIAEAPLEEIRKHQPSAPGVLGLTSPRTNIDFATKGDARDNCKLVWKSPAELILDHYEVPLPGTYDYKMPNPPAVPARCKGIPHKEQIVIDRPMTERLKDGEREHCEDHKLAWAKLDSRAVQALDEMTTGYCGPGCLDAAKKRFEMRLGFGWETYRENSECLFKKTAQERDLPPHQWHSADAGPPVFSADCKTVTYTYNAKTALPDVGNHKPETVITGCGT